MGFRKYKGSVAAGGVTSSICATVFLVKTGKGGRCKQLCLQVKLNAMLVEMYKVIDFP